MTFNDFLLPTSRAHCTRVHLLLIRSSAVAERPRGASIVSLNISLSQSRSFEMTLKSSGTVSSHSIVTMALCCIISEIKRDFGRKPRLFIPTCIRRPLLRLDSCWIIAVTFGVEKLEWCGYPVHGEERLMICLLSRFDTISACDRHIDRWTSFDNNRAMYSIARGKN